MKADIGIIGAMQPEVDKLISMLDSPSVHSVCGIDFYLGELYGKRVVVAKCGVGKVFASICATAMIITFSPSLIVNTGVGGAIKPGIKPTDIVIAGSLVQHDMDTSPLGDPKGLISGINKVFFGADNRAVMILSHSAEELGYDHRIGVVATGDRFVASREDKESIRAAFDADACEMEGAAIAHAAYVAKVPFAVIRAISDSADDSSSMDYMKFLPIAAERSANLALKLIEQY